MGLDITIDIKPEDVDEVIKKAVIESALGKQLQDAVRSAVNTIQNDWMATMKKKVEAEIERIIRDELSRGESSKKIREAVLAKLSEGEYLDSIIDHFIQKLVSQAARAW